MSTPRYSPRPLPPYRYLPGRGPHPLRDPAGHSHGIAEPELGRFEAECWDSCAPYLYGVDLFNHGYYWEAHEALEAVWVAAGRRSETGRFLQGLIQIAAARVKLAVGAPGAAKSLAALGVAKLREHSGVFLGIDVAAFADAVEPSSADPASAPQIRLDPAPLSKPSA